MANHSGVQAEHGFFAADRSIGEPASPESNYPEISPGIQLNHETRDLVLPGSVIDLSTPNEQNFLAEIILVHREVCRL